MSSSLFKLSLVKRDDCVDEHDNVFKDDDNYAMAIRMMIMMIMMIITMIKRMMMIMLVLVMVMRMALIRSIMMSMKMIKRMMKIRMIVSLTSSFPLLKRRNGKEFDTKPNVDVFKYWRPVSASRQKRVFG